MKKHYTVKVTNPVILDLRNIVQQLRVEFGSLQTQTALEQLKGIRFLGRELNFHLNAKGFDRIRAECPVCGRWCQVLTVVDGLVACRRCNHLATPSRCKPRSNLNAHLLRPLRLLKLQMIKLDQDRLTPRQKAIVCVVAPNSSGHFSNPKSPLNFESPNPLQKRPRARSSRPFYWSSPS
jgi:hypothetical protein